VKLSAGKRPLRLADNKTLTRNPAAETGMSRLGTEDAGAGPAPRDKTEISWFVSIVITPSPIQRAA
jgi:hypothetical protein